MRHDLLNFTKGTKMGTYRIKIAVSFFISLSVCLILFLCLLLWQQNNFNEKDRKAYDLSSFTQFCSIFETQVLESVYSLVQNTLFSLESYETLTSAKEQNPFNLSNDLLDTSVSYQNKLAKLQQAVPCLQSIDLYSTTYDTYISSSKGIFSNISQNQEYYTSLLPLHCLNAAAQSSQNQFWLLPEDTTQYSFLGNNDIVTLVTCLPFFSTPGDANLLILLHVDTQAVYDIYFKNQMMANTAFSVITTDGDCIMNTASDFAPALALSDIPFRKKDSGFEKLSLAGNTYHIFWARSLYNSWSYIYISETPDFGALLFDSLGYFMLAVLIGGALCFLLSILVSRSLYKPIGQLVKKVTLPAGTAKNVNDLEMISEMFTLTRQKLSRYEAVVQKSSSLVLSNIVQELLHGEIASLDELQSRLSILDLKINYPCFFLFIVKMESNVLDGLDPKQRDLLIYTCLDIINNFYPVTGDSTIRVLSNCSASNYINVVVNIREDAYSEEINRLPKLLAILEQEFLQIFNIAVSAPLTSPSEFYDSHDTISSYFKYGFIYGNGNIFTKQQIAVYESTPETYDNAFLRNISNLFKEGKFDELRREISIFYENTRIKQYSYLYMHSLSLQIIGIFIQAFNANDLPVPLIDGEDLLTSFQKLSNIESCAAWYSKVIDLFSEMLQKRTLAIHDDYMENILHFIDENVTTVSLESVADRFKISVGHFSRLFKKTQGVNFSEYVIQKKMELACAMLTSSEKNVNEISTAIGYYNVNYFSKIFKEFYKMTPTQYRKLNSGKKAENKAERMTRHDKP